MNQKNVTQAADASGNEVSQPPWWRLPIVWMVIGGPAAVVVASLFTVVLAVKNIDPVIDVSKTQATSGLAPALQARNHAAEKSLQPADH